MPTTRAWRHALLLLLTLATWAALTAPPAQAQGITVAIGGALKDENAAIWQRLVQLAGGPGARFAIFATAAGDPDRSAAAIAANLQRHGAVTEHIRVAPLLPGSDVAAGVRDTQWTERVNAARGVFFSGGAQERLMDTLQPGGQPSPLLRAVQALWQRGGVVAGTSSGAAVLSATAFRDAPDLLAALADPAGALRDGHEVDRGFGFLPGGVVVDQHFLKRGRIGRLLPLLAARGLPLGLGVEEDSAAIVRGDEVEALGARGVLVLDLSGSTVAPGPGPLRVRDVALSYLDAGDRFDLKTRRVVPALRKSRLLDPNAPGHRGYFSGPVAYPDMLADDVILSAMVRLVDGAERELHGLSFDPRLLMPAAAAGASPLGFAWRLHVGPRTRAHTSARQDDYTLEQVLLDVAPVTMARPLSVPFIPLPAAARR